MNLLKIGALGRDYGFRVSLTHDVARISVSVAFSAHVETNSFYPHSEIGFLVFYMGASHLFEVCVERLLGLLLFCITPFLNRGWL